MTDLYPAQYYQMKDNGIVECELCPHNCKISNNKVGICKVRKNIDGKLYSLNYGQISSLGVDPVEKNLFTIFTHRKKFFLWAAGAVI